MIILITGASHTGKTTLAQKLLERYHYPVLSLDLLKMGLIRSGQTDLTPENDDALVPYLWHITSEIVKTAIENDQNLIVEGCYIPFTWQEDFEDTYLEHIEYCCLVMSEHYIETNKSDIATYENVIETRQFSGLNDEFFDELIRENKHNLEQCQTHHLPYCLIDSQYKVGSLYFETLKATNTADALKAARLFHDTIHSVNCADYRAEELEAWSPNGQDYLLEIASKLANEDTLLAKECGIVVGFASLDANCDLDMLYVHKDRQYQGIASKLLAELEDKARSQGKTSIQTYASITARPFFERRGYQLIEKNIVVRRGVQLHNYLMKRDL